MCLFRKALAGLTVFVCLGAAVLHAQSRAERAENWWLAAASREHAAAMHQRQSTELMELGRTLKSHQHLYDEERRDQMNRAGDMEKRAGDLEGKAAKNFDMAQANWRRAAREYELLGEIERKDHAQSAMVLAKESAHVARKQQIHAFEEAALSYSDGNAGQPAKAAAASERAAQCRETLPSFP